MIQEKMKIVWITADYFIDVDFLLVPYLQKIMSVDWYVIKGFRSNVHIEPSLECHIIEMRHRAKDPRILSEYYMLFQEIKLKRPDIIYSDFVGVPYYYPLLLNLIRKIPVIHAAHNVIPYEVWPTSLRLYVKYVFKKNKYFQFFSQFTAQYFCKLYPQKSYFYCPMTLKGYGLVSTNHYQIDRNKINLLFFGNVIANKRLDLLINAVKNLPNEIKCKVHLSICGKCNDTEKYTKLIGDSTDIITTNFKRIPDCDVAELFSKHQYLVLPYQDVAQSGPHMIAYYYNLPVIASNIDGFSEKIVDGENGFLFKVNDEQSLMNVIEKVVSLSPEQYSRIKTSLRKYADDNFGLRAITEKYMQYFHSILK